MNEKPVSMPVRFYKSQRLILARWSKNDGVSQAEIVRMAVRFYDKSRSGVKK